MAEDKKMVSFNLPKELITEILVRLPARSLLRFKSVCKTWYCLIENPNFIEKHEKSNPLTTSILVTTTNKLYINNGGFYKLIDFGSLFSRKTVDYFLLGVCNGLVCIAFYRPKYIVICNPLTQKFRKISWFKLPIGEKDYNLFGFSFLSNDFKIVRTIYGSVVKAEVYSMSSDRWEKIDVKMAHVVMNLPGDACYFRFPVELNGVFHWMVSYFSFARVLSFDIYKRVFYEINIPTSVLDALKDSWCIIEFEKKLSLIVFRDDCDFELWVFNENTSTWTWKLKIDDISTRANPLGDWEGAIDVVGYTKNGELLVEYRSENDSNLISYDLHSREIKSLPNFDYHEDNYYYFYTESLRSVKSKNEVAEAG